MYRILCIEDDASTRNLLKKVLESSGMHAEITWSGAKGLEAALNGRFDCIIVDLLLPDIDGFQTIRQLRSSDLTRTVPILVLTAKADEASWRRAKAVGADRIHLKPFHQNELVDEIRALVQWSKEEREKEVPLRVR